MKTTKNFRKTRRKPGKGKETQAKTRKTWRKDLKSLENIFGDESFPVLSETLVCSKLVHEDLGALKEPQGKHGKT